VILSGPSGVGKDAILKCMKSKIQDYFFATTVTTRIRRPNETGNVDYTFVNKQAFSDMIESDELLEWANVYGNFYGVPKTPIRNALKNGEDVIIKVDIQGAATIKQLIPDAVLIFLAPPDVDVLLSRLTNRKSETPEDIDIRIQTAHKELREASKFDHVVVNHHRKLDQAVSEIEQIIEMQRCLQNSELDTNID